MKNIINYSFIVSFLLFSVFACTDLEVLPDSQLTSSNAFKNKNEFLNGLSGVYSTLGVYGDQLFKVNETSSDEAIVPARGADWKAPPLQNLHKHTWQVSNGEINGAYEALSRGIAQANIFMGVIAESDFADDSEVKIMNAEARFLRAFYYYNMLDMFGDVPIVTEPIDPSDPPSNKNTDRTDVYNFVISELETLTLELPETNDYGRVDRYAAYFLLAKTYINAEVFTGNPELDKAIENCDKLINSSYQLSDDFSSVFAWNNDNNLENIFVWRSDSQTGNWGSSYIIHNFTLNQGLQQRYGMPNAPWNGFSTIGSFYRSFSPGDLRSYIFLEGNQLGSNGEQLFDRFGDTLNFTIDYVGDIDNATQSDGVRVLKYVPGGNLSACCFLNNDFAVFRFADVLLMKAEALIRKNGPGAGDELINNVRERAFTTPQPLTNVDLDELLAERGREFAWELWRRNDLIRFGKFNDSWEYKNQSEPFRTLFPIPQQQIDANPNLEQNPGY